MRPGYRPATAAEATEDYLKRLAAIEEAEANGTHSARQIAEAREVLSTFAGYPRRISGDTEPAVSATGDER
jgi:hypothetical protein